MPLLKKQHEIYLKGVEKLLPQQAIKDGSQISLLRRVDSTFCQTAIHFLIQDILIHYNALDKISDDSIKNLSGSIMGKFWWMKIEEIAYVFNRAKNGGYGRSYKNISADEILSWLNTYDLNEREQTMLDYNRSLQEASSKAQILTDGQLKDFYKTSVGIDNSESLPDGSKRSHEREKDDSEYQKEKLRILNELKNKAE